MITLYQTPPAWGLPTFSPFCLKVETYLRMVDLPYEVKVGDIRKAPKGKVPWIEDEGEIIADSSQIVSHLKARHGDPLDEDLSADNRAWSLVLQRTMEEHTYFALAWLRWTSEAAAPYLREAFQGLVPKLMLGFVIRSVRKSVRKQCHAQGIGRHGRDEIVDRVRQDLDALSQILGTNRFFLGGTPRALDATMYGFLAQVRGIPWEAEEKELLEKRPNLVTYCKRMKELYYTDTDATADTIDATGLGAVVSAIAAKNAKKDGVSVDGVDPSDDAPLDDDDDDGEGAIDDDDNAEEAL